MFRTRADALRLAGTAAAMTLVGRPVRAQTTGPVIRMGTILADSFAQPSYAVDGGFLDRAGITGQVNTNRDLAKRFVAAMFATAQWANMHCDLTVPILSKYSKIDLDTIKTIHRAAYATG
jgi:hypothetical protein